MKARSSGQVRGIQMCAPVGGNFYDTDTRSFVGQSGFHKTIVFVRSFEPGLAHQLRQRGHIIGFDIIDQPVAILHKLQKKNPEADEIDWSTLSHGLIDFYIVNNTKSKDRLADHITSSQKVYVIPHHAATYNLVTRDDRVPATVGYVGLPDQIDCLDKIRIHVESLGLSLFTGHPSSREECCEMLEGIDIGIIFLERNKRTTYVLDYKPNQKLSNFQCFGIPTIACNYNSFHEFGDNAFISVESIDDVMSSLTQLCSSTDMRVDLRKKGYKAGENLLISAVSSKYKDMINEVQTKQ